MKLNFFLNASMLFLVFTTFLSVGLLAQEIEIADERIYLRCKNGMGTMYLYPTGGTVFASKSSTAFNIVIDSPYDRAFRVLDEWRYPEAFIIYGDGTVEANGIALHSDSVLKSSIEELGSQTAAIKMLKAKKYKLKDKGIKGDKKSYGFLAQDLEKIYPDMVFTNDSSGVKSIFYHELIPILLQVTQEQQILIESQINQLHEIEKRLAKLEQTKNK